MAAPRKTRPAEKSALKPAPRRAPNAAARPAARKAARPAARPASPPAAEPAQAKPAKSRLVRDSFTFPAADHQLIGQLKQRALELAQPAKKSEVLRAGLKALAAMGDAALKAALAAVPSLKSGRPKGGKDAKPAKADKPKKKAARKA